MYLILRGRRGLERTYNRKVYSNDYSALSLVFAFDVKAVILGIAASA